MAATLTIPARTRKAYRFRITTDGTSVDYTTAGWSASLAVAPNHDAAPILELTPGSGLTLGVGYVDVEFLATQTDHDGRYVFDLLLTPPAGAAYDIQRGSGVVVFVPAVRRG